MEKYLDKYRIESTRLKNHDYGSTGYYFVTLLTKDRKNYFGEIVNTENSFKLAPSETGKIATQYWMEIPKHFPFVELDEYVIMPNHIHGILYFNKPDSDYRLPKNNHFGPQSKNLGSIIRGFKAATKKYTTLNNIDFAWQSLYHDSILRSKSNLLAVRKYIKNNLAKGFYKQEGLSMRDCAKTHDYASQTVPDLNGK